MCHTELSGHPMRREHCAELELIDAGPQLHVDIMEEW